MKIMKKLIWIALLLVIFTSCNSGPPPLGTDPDNSSDGETTVAATYDTNHSEDKTDEPKSDETVHIHTWGEWYTVREATCFETGVSERSCSCGEKEAMNIEALKWSAIILQLLIFEFVESSSILAITSANNSVS